MNNTKEQQAYIDYMAKLNGGASELSSCAGSGKTHTLKEGVKETCQINPNAVVKVFYFNSSNAKEAQKKFKDAGLSAEAMTFHSLAYRHFSAKLRAEQQINKQAKSIISKLGSVNTYVYKGMLGSLIDYKTIRDALLMIDRYCKTMESNITIDMFSDKYYNKEDITLDDKRQEALELAEKIWGMMMDANNVRAKISHSHYLKAYSLLGVQLNADLLVVDESQDTNECTMSILMAQKNNPTICFIGDENQAINKWNGAVNASDYFVLKERMKLTRSFRNCQPIVDLSAKLLNKYLPTDEPYHFDGTDGEGQIKEFDLHQADAVICRTNATRIAYVIRAVRAGLTPTSPKGFGELIRLTEDCLSLFNGVPTKKGELAGFNSWMDLVEHSNTPLGSSLKTPIGIAESGNALELINKLKELSNARYSDITIVTAHSSKGLEYPNVILAEDFKLDSYTKEKMERQKAYKKKYPHKPITDELREPDTLGEQGAKLMYVAITRASNNLDISRVPYLVTLFNGWGE